MIGKVLSGIAALSLVAAPVAAQEMAGDSARSAAFIAEGESVAGESAGLLALAAVVAAIAAAFLITGSDDDQPTSP